MTSEVSRGACAVCGEIVELHDGVVRYHNYLKPTRQLCRGSREPPASADFPPPSDGKKNA